VAESKTAALVKSLEELVAEKQAVTSKEQELVDGLNAVLAKMGYRVVAASAVPKRRGRPPGTGRPKGSGRGQRRRGPGRPPKAAGAPKRRGPGRPLKLLAGTEMGGGGTKRPNPKRARPS
jgi:hypothetical protein